MKPVAPEAAPNAGSAFAAALFQEWERAGVAHVCICPGSRSGPLAIAAARSGLRHWVHLDERSAAFFALGLAKASREPVALLCTSGTAAANFAPAVIEAHYARVPLLVLTADRPPELREWGAGQSIDQHGLFGSHLRWFAEVATPEASPDRLRYARALAARAVESARGRPAGPVHLNLPFRDPLDPRPVPGEVPADLAERDPNAARGRDGAAYTRLQRGRVRPTDAEADALARRLLDAERGALVCGPLDASPEDVAGIAALAERLGWPLLAEATSPLRAAQFEGMPAAVDCAHWLLASPRFADAERPDVVLRFGAAPTGKPLARWIDGAEALIGVDPDALWHDPSHRAAEIHRAAPEELCASLLERLPPRRGESPWRERFRRAEARARDALTRCLDAEDALLEPCVVPELTAAVPPDTLLYVSSSMPVRDLDAFWPAASNAPRVLCNRGANGIDGMVSSALGAAAAGRRCVLFCGDLALLHDVSGLLAAQRFDLPLVVVAVDNDGGGIFSMLPVADYGAEASFDELFRTPHGHDLRALCAGAGLSATRVESWPHFRAALKEAGQAPGPQVLVVPCEAEASLALRQRVADEVNAALEETP